MRKNHNLTTSYLLLLLSTLSLLFCLPEEAACERRPNILVLNSYHRGYEWSDGITAGIEHTIFSQFPEADIRLEYMNTKRGFSREHF